MIELDIAGVRGKIDEVTIVFEGHAAGKNQQGHFTVEELSLLSTPPSGQSLGGSPAQYKPYPPSFRGEETETAVVSGASMGESGYGTRRDFLIRMKDAALLAGAVAVFGPGVLAQEAVRGPVAANPLLARAALQGAHQILGRSIVALRNGAGLPYNQTRGAFNPGEGWLKSSDLGMSLAADIVMAAGASAYPAENNFQPRQVIERVKTLLTFYSRAVGYYGLKVGGSQTGILPEFLSYRGARIVAEEHDIPGTNQRGIPYAAYDMAMTVEWLMRTAEIFKGGVIEGLKDDSVVRLAEGILRQTNLQAFVDKDGRLHSQVFLTARGEIIQSPGVIDNKHTEAKMLLPLIYGGKRNIKHEHFF